MIDLTDVAPHASVPQQTVERFSSQVPDELVEIWERYGYGTFHRGFFKVVDPGLYLAEIGDTLGRVEGNGIAIPIFVTGLADVICWEPEYGVIAIMHRRADTRGLG